jgi:phage shock protein E
MKNKWFKKGLFLAGGSIAGFAYYYFIGCNSGACPITGNPVISTLYGALIGGVLSIDQKKKSEKHV